MVAFNPGAITAPFRNIARWWRRRTDRSQPLVGAIAILVSTVFLCALFSVVLCMSNHKWCIAGPWSPPANETDTGFPNFEIDSSPTLDNVNIADDFGAITPELTSAVNTAFLPHESFLTVYVNRSHTNSTQSIHRGSNVNIHDRVEYDEHIVCIGAQLKTALDNQDPTYLQESQWQDFSIMYNDAFWDPSRTNGFRTTLDRGTWGEYLRLLMCGLNMHQEVCSDKSFRVRILK
jgi:hypothetical protein